MKKSAMISIQPYWVFLIIAYAKGWNILQRKTVEVRKDYPKSPEWDNKTFIYCSKDKKSFKRIPKEYQPLMEPLLGKVVGEFICDEIDNFHCSIIPYCVEHDVGYNNFVENGVYYIDKIGEKIVFERNDKYIDTMLKNEDLKNMCLSAKEVFDYVGIGKHFYGWHISDLKVYKTPKELSEFCNHVEKTDICRKFCFWASSSAKTEIERCFCARYEMLSKEKKHVTRPPQSWQFIERG